MRLTPLARFTNTMIAAGPVLEFLLFVLVASILLAWWLP